MQKYSRLLLQMLFNGHLGKLGSKSLTQKTLPGMCSFWDVSWGFGIGLVTVRQPLEGWGHCTKWVPPVKPLTSKEANIVINLQQHSWSSKQKHSCARFCTNIIKDVYLQAKYTKQMNSRVKEVVLSPFHTMRPEMDKDARLFTPLAVPLFPHWCRKGQRTLGWSWPSCDSSVMSCSTRHTFTIIYFEQERIATCMRRDFSFPGLIFCSLNHYLH